jgi:hypothetical protein
VRGRGHRRDYGWSEAQAELEGGVHPGVVAMRLNETEDNVREVAGRQGWAISWDGEPTRALFAAESEGLDV